MLLIVAEDSASTVVNVKCLSSHKKLTLTPLNSGLRNAATINKMDWVILYCVGVIH